MVRLLDRVIEAGILFLIIFTPLMFGSVHVRNFCIMQFVAFTLILIWMVKMILTGRYEFKRTPMDWFLLGFVALILFQLVPLPPKVIKTLSPNTYTLYNRVVHDYDTAVQEDNTAVQEDNQEEDRMTVAGIAFLPKSMKMWRTLSIYPHATKTLLLKVLAYLAIFYLIINNTSKRKQLGRIVWAIILVGFFEGIYGAVEYFSGHQHIFFFEKIACRYSLTGTFINGNHLAGYLDMVIPLSLGLLYAAQNGFSRRENTRLSDSFGRETHLAMVIGVLALYMMVSLIFTGSRMGIICVLISLILFHMMLRVHNSTGATRRTSKALILSAVLLAVYLGITPILARFSSIPEQFGPGGRWGIWATTAGLWKDFPVLGTGLGTYEFILPKYLSEELGVIYDHAHNDYLELLSDMGLAGFLLLGAGISLFLREVFLIWTGRRNRYVLYLSLGAGVGIFALFVHGVADFNMHIPSNALLFFILLGVCLGVVTSNRHEERTAGRSIGSFPRPRFKLMALGALAIGLVSLLLLSETYSVYAGDRLYRCAVNTNHTTSQKAALLKGAMAKDPWNALYPSELAKLESMKAVDALEMATSLNPTNARYWHALGVEGMTRGLPNAGNALSTAVYLEPARGRYHLAYGWYLLGWRNEMDGLAHVKRALTLNPRDTEKILEITWRLVPSGTEMRRLLSQDADRELREQLEGFLREHGAALPE